MKTRKRRREELDAERQEVLAAIERGDWRSFLMASEEIRGDYDVVLAAVKSSGYDLRHASEELKDNYEIVLAAVRSHGPAIQWASQDLQTNHDIVMAAVNENGWALQNLSSELRANQDVVLAATRTHRWAFQFASEDLKADEEFIFTTVRELGWTRVFQFTADNLRDDHDFVVRALRCVRGAFGYGWRVGFDVLDFVSNGIKREIRATAQKFRELRYAQAFLHGKLQSHAAFMEFLCCVKSRSAAAAAGIPVTKVNLDKVTSEKLHRHIAEYAGVPLDQGLEPVRLVKRVMPILEVYFLGMNIYDQDLGWVSQSLSDIDEN